jgi:hypothetical protein
MPGEALTDLGNFYSKTGKEAAEPRTALKG